MAALPVSGWKKMKAILALETAFFCIPLYPSWQTGPAGLAMTKSWLVQKHKSWEMPRDAESHVEMRRLRQAILKVS